MPKKTLTLTPTPPPTKTSKRSRARARTFALDVDPLSPIASLQPVIDGFDGRTAPAREEFLARWRDPVVGKDGIEFAGTLWWSRDLHRLTSVPRDSEGKRPTLELLYDAAARSRDDLAEVTLVVRDPLGAVRVRVLCVRRSGAQRAANRDEERASQQRHERELLERRTAFERRASIELTGLGAKGPHDTLAAARTRQGRPGDLRGRSVRAGKGEPTPDTARSGRAPASPRASGASARGPAAPLPRGAKRAKSTSAKSTKAVSRAAATKAPSSTPSDLHSTSSSKWTAFNAFAAALGRTKSGPTE